MSFRIAAALLLTWAMALGQPAFAQLETRASFFVGSGNPWSLVVGDFNGDGILDVAVVNYLPFGSVEILLGNGDGTFRHFATYRVGVQPEYAATASFRGNGILDLVVGDSLSDSLYIMLGNGDGTFQSPVAYATHERPANVSTGKFTGSGSVDVLILTGSRAQCNCIQVLPGNGDGTFGAPMTTHMPYGIQGYAVASGDFNNDGKLDVAVSGSGYENQVDILLGNGDGTFTPHGYYTVSETPQSVATGTFTGDKTKLDLAVANGLGSSVSVLLGNGDGSFQQAVDYDTFFPTWVIAQDLDGDGKIDLITSNPGLLGVSPPGVTVLKGNGNGKFQPGVFYPAGSGPDEGYVAAGDFNGDHMLDLVTVNSDGEAIITLLNTGVVSFSPTTPLTFPSQAVGTTSSPKAVKLTNTGSTDLKITSMTASTEFAVKSNCGATVAPSATCTITATFTPTQQGTVQGTITIIDSASSKPQVIEVSGIGTSN
jgi:hypothetical protein